MYNKINICQSVKTTHLKECNENIKTRIPYVDY